MNMPSDAHGQGYLDLNRVIPELVDKVEYGKGAGYKNEFNAYFVYSNLDFYSNFSGYLENPLRGDQLNQKERRFVFGGNGEQTWFDKFLDFGMDNSLGLQDQYASSQEQLSIYMISLYKALGGGWKNLS